MKLQKTKQQVYDVRITFNNLQHDFIFFDHIIKISIMKIYVQSCSEITLHHAKQSSCMSP